ncbi:hypothetical protein nbrc107696_18190 [Gordonia spumicola]|uniref:Histone acetyltransferase Rv0428c-like C-terminal domain-containing protein n=1 Tax=Gordonia spumicola TaxID=589161 RepID=A0A7I9V8F6_9ACTN|nr:GCN5 family acetyltransferase [Gordonia spumicola]GEE01373.1 hypothetical protein nbrc107696_18190 [Gordonia spumicola]
MPSPDPVIGDRVVVRYRLSDAAPADWREVPNPVVAHGPSLSDVTGVLVSSDDAALVVLRDGRETVIPRSAVSSMRTLSRTVVRNSQIRDVERALCAAAGGEHAAIDGWLLRAGGSGLRGNLAVPVDFGASSASLPTVRAWFDDRGLPARALLPDRLVRAGSIPVVDDGDAVEVLVCDHRPPVDAVELADGRWAVTVPADDPRAREAARRSGLTLHHTGRVHTLG